MQSDILPPDNLKRPNTKTPKKAPMRSLRLQGHSSEDARKRLAKAEQQPEPAQDKEPEAEAIIALDINEPRKKGPHHWLKYHLSKRSKVELIVGGVVFLLVLGVLIGLIVHYGKHEPKGAVYVPPVKAEPKPTTVASQLTGVQVDPKLAKRPVTGVMIENSPDARPQSGLQSAGVVYEAIAEGGITRFLALFQESSPQYVGPVRSLRPYFLDFATPYQAGIVHVGGSPEALKTVRNGHYRDLDQFFNAAYFYRISSRYAPHNMYTDFKKLDQLNKSKKYTSSKFTPWKRKDDSPRKVPKVAHIDVHISSPLYYSHYDYDKASNSYKRSEGGVPHLEIPTAGGKANKRIHPKVVIALVMGYGIEADGYHSTYKDTGSGQMFIFQDGGIQKGIWVKKNQSSMFKFLDSTGKKILPINAGQTWITVVSSPGEVTYSP